MVSDASGRRRDGGVQAIVGRRWRKKRKKIMEYAFCNMIVG
jgi:hypothetical protein